MTWVQSEIRSVDLDQSALLTWSESEHSAMADRLMDGAHRFIDRKTAESRQKRNRFWERDSFRGHLEYRASLEESRGLLRKWIGVVDERSVAMEEFGNDRNPALVALGPSYKVLQVRWQSVKGVWCEGLLVKPMGVPVGYVVMVPDADQTPEQILGLAAGDSHEPAPARWLADRGFMMVLPSLINRRKVDPAKLDIPEDAKERLARNDQTHREYLYRQSYHMGRHVIGYEVQHLLAAVDWFEELAGRDAGIGLVGYGEGGLLALYAAAVDTRIRAALVSGYFDSREDTWSEPLYRNVWSLLKRFGDAEMATLIAPRGLVIEHFYFPSVQGRTGRLTTPPIERVRAEFDRVHSLHPEGLQTRKLIDGIAQGAKGPGSPDALMELVSLMGVSPSDWQGRRVGGYSLTDGRLDFHPEERHLRQLQSIENHVQKLVRNSVRVREAFFLHKIMPEIGASDWSTETTHPTHSSERFEESARPFRKIFLEEIMGRFDDPLLPANPRSRIVYRTENWIGHEVVLDVFEDLFAWGILLVPNDLEKGERRPVVVVQHGRNGLPENLIVKDHTAYRRVGAALVERGFIVFVPHNLYRNEAGYRLLNRKANTVGATLYSFIVHQHDQMVRWLNTLPFVDGDRIAFYGNSFGGETALRVPPVLDGYALSISASFFNQWTRKVAGNHDKFSFLFTDEWETPVFNAGHTFDHAEMACLMIPRPFMVERGHHDHVAHDRWVAHEYANVRRVYAMLGIADRTEIEFFQGGHGMRLEGSFDFLHQHLNWPLVKP